MPNRILKESICSSDTLDGLSDFEENLFYRLIVNCDDYGRLDARPAILKSRCYPLRDRLTLKTLQDALQALARVGCVKLYNVDGRPYLHLPTWEVHQQVRAKKSKYPAPDDNGYQMISDDIRCPRNPIQSESVSESVSESYCAEVASHSTPEDAEPPLITLPATGGVEVPVTAAQVAEWTELYPAVDVMQALRSMRGWLLADPKRRKTAGGMMRFVTGWLGREQNRGGVAARPTRSPQTPLPGTNNPFAQLYREEHGDGQG